MTDGNENENHLTGQDHLNLVNDIIGMLNEKLRNGWPSDFAASAAIVAAASFAVFNLEANDIKCTNSEIEYVSGLFAERMKEFQKETNGKCVVTLN